MILFLPGRHVLGLEEERPAVEIAAIEVAEHLAEVDDKDCGLEHQV